MDTRTTITTIATEHGTYSIEREVRPSRPVFPGYAAMTRAFDAIRASHDGDLVGYVDTELEAAALIADRLAARRAL